MARLLALEWDGREARVAVGRQSGKGVAVEEAFTVDLAPRDAGETFADTNVGERLGAALSARNVGRVDALIGVGRAGIELRGLSVPPAPDDELPELVRFQALRQFTALGEDWPLDFVPLSRGEEGLNVLAAAISPELVAQINATCEAGGLTPKRLILRPFAAASLIRTVGADERCGLMVDVLADEADLTVLVERQVVFMRTVRLSTGDSEQVNKALLGEIRRTIVAAQNQLGGRRVEHVVLCGSEANHAELKSQIAAALTMDVDIVNPFDLVSTSSQLRANLPERPGRFAPLLGMLADEASGAAHQIDFLNPRRKAPPPDRRRLYAIAAVAALLLLLTGAGLIWLQLWRMDKEIAELQIQTTTLEDADKKLSQRVTHKAEVDGWLQGDIAWLDELRWVSQEFPRADEAVVESMSISVTPQGGGQMILAGKLKNPTQTSPAIWRSMTNDRHDVTSRKIEPASQNNKLKDYPHAFSATVAVAPLAEDAVGNAPASGGASAAAGTQTKVDQ